LTSCYTGGGLHPTRCMVVKGFQVKIFDKLLHHLSPESLQPRGFRVLLAMEKTAE